MASFDEYLIKLLSSQGPCSGSYLTDRISKDYNLSKSTARQRVSRAVNKSGKIQKLNNIKIKHGSQIYYLSKFFGVGRFWIEIIQLLNENNSVYGMALTIMKKRGALEVDRALAQCGSPIRRKGHIPSKIIFRNLMYDRLIKERAVAGIGQCYILEYNERENNDIQKAQSIEAAEKLILEGLSDWLRNIGLVSYESVKEQFKSTAPPEFNSFHWDLTAPSYIFPFQGRGAPGFVVADVILGYTVDLDSLKFVINKRDITLATKKVTRPIIIVLAEDFSKEAFLKAKESGILPITVKNLYGPEVAKGIRDYINILSRLSTNGDPASEIDKIFESLKNLNTDNGHLRGTLFEILTAQLVTESTPLITTEIGKKICFKGEHAEIDVLAIKQGSHIRIIECKGIKPYSLLSEEEFNRWLSTRIPRVKGWLKDNPEYSKLNVCFELWTTGRVSDANKEEVGKLKSTKQRSYRIYEAEDVRKAAAELDNQHLSKGHLYLPKLFRTNKCIFLIVFGIGRFFTKFKIYGAILAKKRLILDDFRPFSNSLTHFSCAG